jgi:hypothetical protein
VEELAKDQVDSTLLDSKELFIKNIVTAHTTVDSCKQNPQQISSAVVKISAMASSHKYEKAAGPDIFPEDQVPNYKSDSVKSILDKITDQIIKTTGLPSQLVQNMGAIADQLKKPGGRRLSISIPNAKSVDTPAPVPDFRSIHLKSVSTPSLPNPAQESKPLEPVITRITRLSIQPDVPLKVY